MAGNPLVITEALGGSPLSQAVVSGEPPATWYEERPSDAAGWRARAEAIHGASLPSDWLDALRPALCPTGRAAERLAASAAGKGIVVTTGQQPGLFGGPIYTWSKALSALALADELQAFTGLPVAPVFWAATDDSDFAEASSTMVARPGGWEDLRMRGNSTGTSMAHLPLGDVSELFERLARASGSAPYREALDAARRAYHPDATIGGAYLALLRAVLEPLGVAVLDAAHPTVRQRAAPILRAALRDAGAISRAVAECDRALLASGYSPQVASVASLSLVFATEHDQRQRIRIDEASTAVRLHPDEALSPNVLLRPIVERSILPTVAYVAGPAELAYFAQTGAVAAAMGMARPLGVPRWSCTIVEPHVAEILERLGLQRDDLADPHAAEGRVARSSLPADVTSAFARIGNALRDGLAELERHGGDLVPSAVVAGGGRSIEHRLARLERRFLAAVKRRGATVLQDVGTARGSLWPAGKRQERGLNFLPFLARHGMPLMEDMLREARVHAARLVGRAGASGAPARAGASTLAGDA